MRKRGRMRKRARAHGRQVFPPAKAGCDTASVLPFGRRGPFFVAAAGYAGEVAGGRGGRRVRAARGRGGVRGRLRVGKAHGSRLRVGRISIILFLPRREEMHAKRRRFVRRDSSMGTCFLKTPGCYISRICIEVGVTPSIENNSCNTSDFGKNLEIDITLPARGLPKAPCASEFDRVH